MRIHPLSDLHNEFALFTPKVSDADVVILAGDIDLGTKGIEWARQEFDCQVLYVPAGLQGLGITFIAIGLMSLGFMSFSGVQL